MLYLSRWSAYSSRGHVAMVSDEKTETKGRCKTENRQSVSGEFRRLQAKQGQGKHKTKVLLEVCFCMFVGGSRTCKLLINSKYM